MKKSIASVALLVSASSALAIPVYRPPGTPVPQPKTVCLDIYRSLEDGSTVVGSCDESQNNKIQEKELQKNGCAEDQVAIYTFDTKLIDACMPAGMVQL